MAGIKNYIQMRKTLLRDPRVTRMSQALSVTVTHVFGGLYVLWSLADEWAEADDRLPHFTREDIDAEVGIEGFAAALPKEWLDERDGELYTPRYQEENGSTAKTRASSAEEKRDNDAQRQRRHRAKKGGVTEVSHPVTRDSETVTATSRHRRGEDRIEEEKRTEDRREEDLDETRRDDHVDISCLSWDDVFCDSVTAYCRRVFSSGPEPVFRYSRENPLPPEDRWLLLRVAALHLSDQIPEQWIISTLESIRRHDPEAKPIENRASYFTDVLYDEADKVGKKKLLKKLLATIELPERLRSRRVAEEMTENTETSRRDAETQGKDATI